MDNYSGKQYAITNLIMLWVIYILRDLSSGIMEWKGLGDENHVIAMPPKPILANFEWLPGL